MTSELEAHCPRIDLERALFEVDALRLELFSEALDTPIGANAGIARPMAIKPPWEAPATRE
jgi:uncharacterized protein (DUF1778 family)